MKISYSLFVGLSLISPFFHSDTPIPLPLLCGFDSLADSETSRRLGQAESPSLSFIFWFDPQLPQRSPGAILMGQLDSACYGHQEEVRKNL